VSAGRPRLGLGTAQLGLDYGVTNREGRPDEDAVAELLALAWRRGVRVLDTAPGYGCAEERIGRLRPVGADFAVVTKTPLHPPDDPPARCAERVVASAHASLERLRLPRLAGLLEHRPQELLSPRGEAIAGALQRLREERVVERVGASVYDAEVFAGLAARHALDLVQLPVSVLDRRALDSGRLAELRGRGVAVHARSVFLQGLLLAEPEAVPGHLAPLRVPLRAFRREAAARGLAPLEAAMGFALARPELDVVLCGAQRAAELAEILDAAERAGRSPRHAQGWDAVAVDDPRWLDPSRWPAARGAPPAEASP